MSVPELRVLICDDEAMARKRLTRLLASIEGVSLVEQCTNGREVLEHLRAPGALSPDVLLLDVRMPEVSGLEASALLPDDGPYVIFTTAHSEHALEAFDAGADDYLLKPIDIKRLDRALQRARLRLGRVLSSADGQSVRSLAQETRPIGIPTKTGVELLNPTDISHISLEGELTTIVAGASRVLSDQSLGQLQARLPDSLFWRVHRRALVNLQCVSRLTPNGSGGYKAHMMNGDTLPISRQVGRRLRKFLGLG